MWRPRNVLSHMLKMQKLQVALHLTWRLDIMVWLQITSPCNNHINCNNIINKMTKNTNIRMCKVNYCFNLFPLWVMELVWYYAINFTTKSMTWQNTNIIQLWWKIFNNNTFLGCFPQPMYTHITFNFFNQICWQIWPFMKFVVSYEPTPTDIRFEYI